MERGRSRVGTSVDSGSSVVWDALADLKKKRLDRETYCLHAPKFEARLFDRRHLVVTTLRVTAYDLRSEDYESKT